MPALGEMLDKFNPWHRKDEPPPPPPITARAASILVVLYALVYFLPFYASSLTRPSPTLTRDAPSVIKARITSVTISCVICCLTTYLILVHLPPPGSALAGSHVIHLMGFWPIAVVDSLKSLFLTALLFLGPLFSYFVVEAGWREWTRLEPLTEVWTEWTTWRNLVAGPVTEEILYRSASTPLMVVSLSSQTSSIKTIIFLTPLIFGLSHVHHFYEFRLTNPRVPAAAALFRSLFQLSYTTVFGAYATFLFVRTGSLLSVCAVHAFCNCMGLPQLWGRVEPPDEPLVPVPAASTPEGLRQTGQVVTTKRASILWTVAYYVLLVAGAVLWYRNLWVLTDSGNALVPDEAFSAGRKG